MLRATISGDRAMEVFRVDEMTRQPALISRSAINFDARIRPWYTTALAYDGTSWYAPYRYKIEDVQGAYQAIGMGASAPLRSQNGDLVGVVTADVSLSQLNDFLNTVASESGGKAFLAEASGELLAMSSADASMNRGKWKRELIHFSEGTCRRASGSCCKSANPWPR